MKRLHKFLKVFIFVQLGSCAGDVLRQYMHYVNHPERYITWSAPWYTGIQLTVALTAVTVALTAMAYFAVGRMIRRREVSVTEGRPPEGGCD